MRRRPSRAPDAPTGVGAGGEFQSARGAPLGRRKARLAPTNRTTPPRAPARGRPMALQAAVPNWEGGGGLSVQSPSSCGPCGDSRVARAE